MVITINKDTDFKKIDRKLQSLKGTRKLFRSERFSGKIKWGEDALKYQKKIRDEWN